MAGIVTFCVNNLQMDLSGFEGAAGVLWFSGSEGAAGVFWFSGSEGAAGAAKAAEDYFIGFAVPHGGEGSWQNLKHLDMDASGETW